MYAKPVLFVLTCGLFFGASVASGPVAAAEKNHFGAALYRQYCAACHGESGRGDGIVGTFLRPKPTDLTKLAAKADGKFPFYEVMTVIDGRQTIRAHGDPDMPVWGQVFAAESRAGLTEHLEVSGKLLLITDYVRTLQED